MIVLDTNVLSDLFKPAPSPAVENWLRRQAASELFTTAVTQAEILYGVTLLPKGKRRSSLETAVTSIFEYDFPPGFCPSMQRPLSYSRRS